MKKVLLFFVALATYLISNGQGNRVKYIYTPVGIHIGSNDFTPIVFYRYIPDNYRWLRGAFDSTLSIPYGTTADLRNGYTNRPALFYRTTDSMTLTWTGTQFIPIRGAGLSSSTFYNSNVGSGYRHAIPGTNDIKTSTFTNGLTPDSATSNQIGVKLGGIMTQSTSFTSNSAFAHSFLDTLQNSIALLTLSGKSTGGIGSSIFRIVDYRNGTIIEPINIYVPNMQAGQYAYIQMGKGIGTDNGFLAYRYMGLNNDSNAIGLGHTNFTSNLTFNRNGNVGINTPYPNGYGFTNSGSAYFTGSVRFGGLNTTAQPFIIMSDANGNLYRVDTTGMFGSGGGGGDMVLASPQTNSGEKTFLDGSFKLRNVANTFDGEFNNTNTADRVWDLQDKDGMISFLSDITDSLDALGSLIIRTTPGVAIAKQVGIDVDIKSFIDGANIDIIDVSDSTFKAEITGQIPVANGGTGKSSITANSYVKGNGTSAMVERTYSEVKTDLSLNNVDNTSNATERAAVANLTNKAIVPRVGSTTSSATPTVNADVTDIYKLTAQTADITSMTTNLSGTFYDGQIIEFQITGTASRAITWGSSFVDGMVTLPTTTSGTTTLVVVVQYMATGSFGTNKFACMNKN